MADLLYLLITVAFFAIAVGFVRVCDRVIGPDSEFGTLTDGGEADPAATTTSPTAGEAVTTGAGR